MLAFLLSVDYWIFSQINDNLTCVLGDSFFVGITDLHKTTSFKFIVIPLVLYIFTKKFKREGVTLFIYLILALSVSDFSGAKIKNLFERPRPSSNSEIKTIQRSEAGNFSFYSNHASNMFTFASYTSQFVPQLKIPLYLIASLVAYSRVYNGVHYPSDILAGGIAGYFWGLLFSRLAQLMLNYIRSKKKIA